MKDLTVFETSILGFFAGIVVSTYTSFVANSGGYVGKALDLVTLNPLFEKMLEQSSIQTADGSLLILSFLFIVLVFTVYGGLVGLALKFLDKPKFVVIGLIVILLGVSAEQTFGHIQSKGVSKSDDFLASVSQPFTTKKTSEPKTYFGMEAWGDLTGENTNDVAFIIHREDAERGMLYYLTTALESEKGKAGTNLIFLGDKVVPANISIENQTINITLTPESDSDGAHIFAKVINGDLERLEFPLAESTTETGTSESSPSI